MITPMSNEPLKVDFGWIGAIPAHHKPGESNGHYTFFIECVSCDPEYDARLLQCTSRKQIQELLAQYRQRLESFLPFTMFDEDLKILAANTWKDQSFQRARRKA